ncbi:MAG: peptidylprolyl isomerase [Rhodocyclaceae bacterium]|nr:peptidylprolyl isomerase [Rhodocyclaceae bacterium]
MKHVAATLALALATTVGSQVALAAATIVTVNGQAIPQARADALINEQKAQGQQVTPQMEGAVKEELVRREVLAQEARKQGLEKKADIQAQMELAKQAILIRAYLQDFIAKNPVTDADLQSEYDTIKGRLGNKEYKVRHILVEKEDDAKAIITKLQTGEKFEDLAKQSTDPGSKDKGGDLGWANPGMFVKPFSDAMVGLEKGKFTGTPVKSDFGYHVILLEDVRDLQAPPFEQVKGQLSQRLQQQKVEKHLLELRGKAKVE